MFDLISLTQRFLSSPESISSKDAITSSAPMVSFSIFLAKSEEHPMVSSISEFAIPQRTQRVFSVILMLPSGVVSFKHFLIADLNWWPVAAVELFRFFCLLGCEDVAAIDLTGAFPVLFGGTAPELLFIGVKKKLVFIFEGGKLLGNKEGNRYWEGNHTTCKILIL